jgi:hypothetical protein
MVLVSVSRADRCPPLCQWLLVGLCSVRPAPLVTEGLAARTWTERLWIRGTEPEDRLTPSSPSTRRTPSRSSVPGWPGNRPHRAARSSSPGIVGCPSSDVPTRVHSPRTSRSLEQPGLDRSVPTTVLVPPLWDLTTSTVSSAAWVPGLLHPGTGHGVRWVSKELVVPIRRWLGRGPLPLQRSTLRRFAPRRQPYPIAGVCSLPDRSCPKRRRPSPDGRTRVDEWRARGFPCVSRSDRACATGDARAFPPGSTTRGDHLRGTRGAGLFASSRLFLWTQGYPWPQATSTRTGRIDQKIDRITGPPREAH